MVLQGQLGASLPCRSTSGLHRFSACVCTVDPILYQFTVQTSEQPIYSLPVIVTFHWTMGNEAAPGESAKCPT